MTNGRHSPARRGFFSAVSVRSMLLTTVTIALTLCIVVISSGGTLALLSQQAPVPGATIESGSASLTVSALTLPTTLLYPGLTLAAPVTVTNTGDVPLVLSPSLTPPPTSTGLSAAITVGVAAISSGTVCSASVVPTWTKNFAGTASGSVLTTVPIGASATVCVQVALPVTALATSQGQAASNFALVLTGIQK